MRKFAISRIFLSVTATFLLVVGCSKKTPSSSSAAAPAQAATNSHLPFPSLEGVRPHLGGPDEYIGSQACKSCHEDQHASWHRSYHRTMTQEATGNAVQADFNNVRLTNETGRFTLSKKESDYWVRIEPFTEEGNLSGEGIDVRLGLVTGSHHMQVFWLPEGTGNMQIGFPFTWLIPEKRWVPRHTTFVRPPGMPHRPEVWNIVCSRCHSTGVEPRANVAARTMETEIVEHGISCEACHGPGRKHVDLRKAGLAPGAAVTPGEIIQPKNLDADRSAQVCGFCHSMKWIDKSSSWRDRGFAFRPGDDLEQTTPVIRAHMASQAPALKEYLARNPGVLNDFFWSDGMVRVSGREYNGLIESPCAKSGKFSCLSCHSMHDSDPNDQLAARGKSNSACTQCHDKFKSDIEISAHTHHLPGSTGSECYNCHMPHTTYGVLKGIRSHQVSSPNVAHEKSTGRPNACNLCHLDKPLAWTSGRLETWYSQKFPPLDSTDTNVSHVLKLALAGDAGQRALAAWHLSWPPALQASGTNWIPPLLAELLDDPYDAVRCLAERSIKSFPPFVPPGYDFVDHPSTRASSREFIWGIWTRENPNNPALQQQLRTFGEMKAQRIEHPVRLRE